VEGGARAVSVLTDPRYFGGSLADLAAVRAAVDVPVLRKDFIVDPLQLLESRVAGASAVLLIVRALEPRALAELSDAARELGLARLIEVHDATELERAVPLAPEAIGVNARDLDTFAVTRDGVAPVLRAVPPGIAAVAESGIERREDVERVAAWGADAILVGTALARAPDPAMAVRQLAGVARAGPRRLATNRGDATP
jgi:indole-3-glycerol phosphate synthase